MIPALSLFPTPTPISFPFLLFGYSMQQYTSATAVQDFLWSGEHLLNEKKGAIQVPGEE